MGRVLAIDYGRKRAGIAVTDELRLVANALTTVQAAGTIAFIREYIKKEIVDIIVVGEPRKMNNIPSESVIFIEPFVKQLKKEFPDIVVKRMDERFTSKMAFQTMIDAGLTKKARQNKALVDALSATILLQSFLECDAEKFYGK